MKIHPTPTRPRGFTLIELLVVITIIGILAAISMSGFSFITRKKAEEQARVQISLLEKALEEYKLDNGEYPGTNTTETATALFDPLYQTGANLTPPGKIYLAELDPNNKRQGWIRNTAGAINIVDPWGNEYIYRRGDHTNAKNPDFDLASMGNDGITNNSDPNAPENQDDIANY
jgi:general secretion pathway protein G